MVSQCENAPENRKISAILEKNQSFSFRSSDDRPWRNFPPGQSDFTLAGRKSARRIPPGLL